MGYQKDSSRLAASLPRTDAVRLFVNAETEALKKEVEQKPEDRLGQYLALLSLARKGKDEKWIEWINSNFFVKDMPVPVLAAGLELDSFEMSPSLSNALLHGVMFDLSGETGAKREAKTSWDPEPTDFAAQLGRQVAEALLGTIEAKPAGLVRRFETALTSRAGSAKGPLWNSETVRSYWRSHFYSGLQVLGSHYLDALSSGPAALDFAQYLEDSPAFGPGADFRRWYSRRASFKSGRVSPREDMDFLASLPSVAGQAMVRVFADLRNALASDPTLRHEAMHHLSRNLDGRARHLAAVLEVVASPLLDLRLVERHCKNLLMFTAHEPRYGSWCTSFLGRDRELFSMVDNRELRIEDRVAAMWFFQFDPSAKDSDIRARYRSLLKEAGYERLVTMPYLEYLENKVKDNREAEEVARGWLAHHGPEEGLVHAIYRGRVAHSLDLQGKHKEAWTLIEPLVDTQQGAIMSWAASILQNLGRPEEALEMARACLARYPDAPEYRAKLAELLWLNGRYSDAALVLNPPEHRLPGDAWSGAGKNFARAFRAKQDEAAILAFEALIAERIEHYELQSLIEELAEQRPGLGFQLQSRLKRPGDTELIIRAYKYLKDAGQPAEALEWLRKTLPARNLETKAEIFLDWKEYELLWDFLEPSPGGVITPFTWNLRAAASRFLGEGKDPHRRELIAHFQDARPDDLAHTLGRSILGLEGAPVRIPAGLGSRERAEAACFLGLRAMGQGAFEEASDWFHLSLLIAEARWQVSALAWRFLGRLYSERGSLKVQAEIFRRQGRFPKAASLN